jgi:MFS family permease
MSLLFPPAVHASITAAVITRVVAGACEGVCFPAMNVLMARWCPPLERSLQCGIIFGACYAGTAIYLPIAGYLCDCDWERSFYVSGGAGCVWWLLWTVLASRCGPRAVCPC